MMNRMNYMNGAAYGEQRFTSADTSINSTKLPRVYKAAADMIRGSVIDYGCGKFFDSYDLSGYDATIRGYDKYSRPDVSALAGEYDVAICSNVLNVVAEKEVRIGIISELRRLASVALVTVYEGNPDKEAGQTKRDCYQMNRRAADYLPELETVYGKGNVTWKRGMFICTR